MKPVVTQEAIFIPTRWLSILGFPLAVVGIVLTVVALRKPVDGNGAELARGWAATLAKQVEAGESPVSRQLLGDDNRRINLAYVLHPAAARPVSAPAAGRMTTDGPDLATLPDIVTYYRTTHPLSHPVVDAVEGPATRPARTRRRPAVPRRAPTAAAPAAQS
ncbi:hypothetical protein ACFRDV_42990 [Streptomyces fagopyri]|uniref:hypothetical protein n=1 Tax=Streptomyces fagopyri TaxID=2662397 RepID=UPI00368AA596